MSDRNNSGANAASGVRSRKSKRKLLHQVNKQKEGKIYMLKEQPPQ